MLRTGSSSVSFAVAVGAETDALGDFNYEFGDVVHKIADGPGFLGGINMMKIQCCQVRFTAGAGVFAFVVV